MLNPENQRLLAEERAAFEAETALSREEQKLSQRLDQLASDALDKRAQALASRVAALASNPLANAAELAKAKAAAAAPGPDPVLSAAERSAALAARRGALQSRELAARALTQSLVALETARAARTRELDQAEAIVAAVDSSAKQAFEERRKAEEAAAAKAADEARKEAERAAAKAKAAAAADDMSKTQPAYKVEVPADKTAPGIPLAALHGDAKTPLVVAPVKGRPMTTAQIKAYVESTIDPAQKRVPRRRRVKLAPPPAKLEFEVANYGENNFYAGFDNKIASGGVFVSSLETLPAGHELELEIDLAGQRIKTRGRVEFVRHDNYANPECSPGAGFKLVGLTPVHAKAIESFFSVRPPMFYVAAR